MPILERVFSAQGELVAALAAGALLGVGAVLRLSGAAAPGLALMWISLAIGMLHGCRAAWDALRELKFDIDVLMVVGAVLAAAVGAPGEGALLLFLFILAGALEALAMGRTRQAVAALHRLMPTAAMRFDAAADGGDAGGGRWVAVSPEDLRPGDRVKILPGESIPADCRMTDATGLTSSVDQASLTGESMPRVVKDGDDLFAGTINVGNPLEAVVTRIAAESSLQRILHMVISAQEQREPVQRAIDRLSQPYAIAVMSVSVAVLLIWWLFLGVPIVDESGRGALYTAITLLIVASPCAVVISTPTATLTAIARAARSGVLFKGGQSIERLARLGALATDKTGTMTLGRPTLLQIHAIGWSRAAEVLAVAAGLEAESTHPIAAAVRDGARGRHIAPSPAVRNQFKAGRGVTGECGGFEARLGTFEHAEPLIPECLRARTRELLDRAQERGQIGIVIAWKDQAGVLVLSDQLRPGADQIVAKLHRLGVRPIVLLTGDNHRTAARVAAEICVDEFHAELMPGEKVAHLGRMKQALLERATSRRSLGVGLIGDGVNDAPALAAADVSIAIGSIGSDAALESADIVLLAEHLHAIPWAVVLARRARRIIAANLTFSLGAIVIMWLVTAIGSLAGYSLPLWAGVLGHEGGTLLVVANSLRLLMMKGHHEPSGRVEPGEQRPAASIAGS